MLISLPKFICVVHTMKIKIIDLTLSTCTWELKSGLFLIFINSWAYYIWCLVMQDYNLLLLASLHFFKFSLFDSLMSDKCVQSLPEACMSSLFVLQGPVEVRTWARGTWNRLCWSRPNGSGQSSPLWIRDKWKHKPEIVLLSISLFLCWTGLTWVFYHFYYLLQLL